MFFKSKKFTPSSAAGLFQDLSVMPVQDMREVEKTFARLFSSDDGKKALAYLQRATYQRVMSADASDAQLRYLEGQRALVGGMMRLAQRGRHA